MKYKLQNQQKIFSYRLKRIILIGSLSLFHIITSPGTVSAIPDKVSIEQQNETIKGTVVDESGEPLIGVNIVVKGSTRYGVVTDIDGNFSISVPMPVTLVFSYIGYQSQEIEVTGNKAIRIKMVSDVETFDEVVVVAYGAQKKVTITGSVASVTNKDLLKTPTTNVASALAGRLPGLTTIQTSGEPGRENVNLFLRGAATTNGTSPLILVDGVPYDNLSSIDPHEIANISVLKDASATAVFGVRGANGVILITTKRGEKGEVEVNVSAEYSMQQFAFQPERINSWDYAVLRNEARKNEGAGDYSEFSKEDIRLFETWETGNPEDPYWHPNQNWQNILFKKFAPMVKTNVNLSGGSDKVQYFINTGYVNQGGIFNVENKEQLGYNPQSSLDRYNFRSNIDYHFNENIKVFANLFSYVEKVNSTKESISEIFVGSLTHRPTSAGPLSNTDYMLQFNNVVSPALPNRVVCDPNDPLRSAYALLNRAGYREDTNSGLNAVAGLDIDLGFITPGLSTKAQVSYDSHARSTIVGDHPYVRYRWIRNGDDDYIYTLEGGDDDSEGPISVSKGTASGYFLNLQWQVNYQKLFGEKHRLGGLVLAQRDYKEASQDDNVTDKYLPFNVIGLSVRGTYAYDDRYLFEVNMGYNGSEQFSPNKRFGFFPAVSAGWVVSNEAFLKNNDVITNLKVRSSFGKVGNDKIGNARFLYLDKINPNGWTNADVLVLPVPSLGHGGKIEENYIGNPDITWEIAEKQNYALDLSLYRNFTLAFDYFVEDRDQILISRGIIPEIQGRPQYTLPKVNMGKVNNKGFEIEAGYNKTINKDFSLGVGLNYSYNKNKVLYADEAQLPEDYAYRYRATGFALGQNWGYQIDRSVDDEKGKDGSGFFNSQEGIEKSGLKYEIGTPLPGDFIYIDQNNDGVINDRDIVPIKYSSLLPQSTYGASLNLQFKGLDFSCLVQGIGKFSKYYADAGIFEELSAKAYFDMHMDRWSEERYEQKLNGEDINISHPRLANTTSTSHVMNDYYIMDASFVRLKNAEIGYTFPARVCRLIGSETIRLYINGNNLYTWHNLKTKGFDPEQTGPTQYPNMRTFNVGLNVIF
ncbi:TonB-linked outer membrane protein, SusC/RagA family [Mariniphaga anaerophila]|uniref:TonB-linked outer membrane protein, SusC/RagA family n=1 Tax=Mariniphaga anaerophila TaxID=1484053 RepID=A0A1M4WJP3_9BACT|nr:TonB-dependent receptor [Mariniphaga anaerophila]SHE81511.1 TonB-linked outer membrane protein, SusC/RagA family [Mariniphaga anaerophila]